MKKLGLQEIRREFLDFFESKGHLSQMSYSLVPNNDNSLLLIGAGMAPIKKYFTGELVPPRTRMATCQKCMRTGDIDNVGKTARHATFFEMLGNFSFGDYFKHEAIAWAWEFLTVNLEIPAEDLWVTVFYEDDEAAEIWEKEIGVPKERIVRLGKKDNFWELEVGPSGPCSEIYVDRGIEFGCDDPDCKPGCDCDRFLEVWNLVFTQFDKDENGVYHPLAHPNIDTGMGLERITTVLENTDNIFEIRAIKDIVEKIAEIANYEYKTDEEKDVSVRVITDHVRAMTFMISDGIIPSNEGRGYVLRRMIRRAARHGRLLGIVEPFLSKVSQVVIDSWSVDYDDLKKNEDKIKSVITNEEKKFLETIEQGMEILGHYTSKLADEGKTTLSGEDAFKLYDTYGFPLDLTKEILEEEGLSVDEDSFNDQMQIQRERARAARSSGENVGWTNQSEEVVIEGDETEFLGYVSTEGFAEITGIYVNNEQVNSLAEGEKGAVILDATPFYGQSGGQIGDKGTIYSEGMEATVYDTKKTKSGIILHLVEVTKGTLDLNHKVITKVDSDRRKSIVRNHSATHLLHKALKEVLGDHVNQAGSEVTDSGFRFDFTHFAAVTKDELKEIEERVNEYIYSETKSDIYELPIEEAFEDGAIGLFEDKYKDKVRIVSFPGISKELCGGTHVEKTSDIGMFKITSEAGIASGVRRIEAITGKAVYEYLMELEAEEESVLSILRANKATLLDKAKTLMAENKQLGKEIESLKKESLKDGLDDILNSKREVKGVNVVSARVDSTDMENLRNLADEIRDKVGNAVVVLGGVNDDKLNFVATVSKDTISKGPKAGAIVKEVATITGGGGGGRPDMATAGGKNINKLDEALNSVYDIVEKML